MPCASNVGIKQVGRFPEKLFITFQTLDRLMVDVRDVQNCRQEDDPAILQSSKPGFLQIVFSGISRRVHDS